MAIKVDGELPLQCASQIIPITEGESAYIRLKCYSRKKNEDAKSEALFMIGEHLIHSWEDLQTMMLSSPCVLLQACLLVYKFDELFQKSGQ